MAPSRASGSADGRVACLGRSRSQQRHDRTCTVAATGETGHRLAVPARAHRTYRARGGAGRRWMRSTRPTRCWASGWAAGRAARSWRTTPAACARRSRRAARAPGPRRAPEGGEEGRVWARCKGSESGSLSIQGARLQLRMARDERASYRALDALVCTEVQTSRRQDAILHGWLLSWLRAVQHTCSAYTITCGMRATWRLTACLPSSKTITLIAAPHRRTRLQVFAPGARIGPTLC